MLTKDRLHLIVITAPLEQKTLDIRTMWNEQYSYIYNDEDSDLRSDGDLG